MKLRLVLPLFCLAGLAACSSGPAPVEDRSSGPPRSSQPVAGARSNDGTYTVVRGDTLYAIAFRYGLDYRTVASWNGIGPPYLIRPGQRLRMTPPASVPVASVPGRTPAERPAERPVPPPVPADAGSMEAPQPRATTRNVPPPVIPVAGEPPAVVEQPAVNASQPPAAAGTAETPPVVTHAPEPVAEPAGDAAPVSAPPRELKDPDTFRWPTSGGLLRTFKAGDPSRSGIDIRGEEGQSIMAAAPGVVVYSGNGLIGYGELLIIKHSERMLSAYAHNRARLVNEGDWVEAGQQIAEMGRNDRNEVLLHFEIRVNGSPQDPLQHLPPR